MGKQLAAWVLAAGLVLMGNQANAQEWMFEGLPVGFASSTGPILNMYNLTCPATVSRNLTVSPTAYFYNPTDGQVTITKTAFSLHLGGTNYVGPKKTTSFTTAPIDPFGVGSVAVTGVTGFNRATAGTIASLGLAFFDVASGTRLLAKGYCLIEVTP